MRLCLADSKETVEVIKYDACILKTMYTMFCLQSLTLIQRLSANMHGLAFQLQAFTINFQPLNVTLAIINRAPLPNSIHPPNVHKASNPL